MRVAVLTVLSSTILGCLMATTAPAQGKQDFTLVNRTGYTVNEIYVAPTSSDDWQEDVLGQDQLENGQRVDISFPRRARSCVWDIKVVYEDEDEAQWRRVNLCEVSTITIRYNRKSGETSATYE